LIPVWRICRPNYAASAFDGLGAKITGGRWNPQGIPMVYSSQSLALAAMECFVNLNTVGSVSLISIKAEIPGTVAIREVRIDELPGVWRAAEALEATQEIGREWIENASSAVLSVPSALIPEDRNYLLNPAHRDFKRIRIGKPRPFSFDPRMWK
jgi:RES domain-containing protein